MRMKEESERASLTLNIKETQIMASGPIQFSSVQFSCSVVSDSLRPHESQHARPPCPAPAPRVHSDSRPSSQWCHPAISSSDALFSFCPQSFSASGTLPRSHLFTSDDQNTVASTSASVLPVNIQGWSPVRLTSTSRLVQGVPQLLASLKLQTSFIYQKLCQRSLIIITIIRAEVYMAFYSLQSLFTCSVALELCNNL